MYPRARVESGRVAAIRQARMAGAMPGRGLGAAWRRRSDRRPGSAPHGLWRSTSTSTPTPPGSTEARDRGQCGWCSILAPLNQARDEPPPRKESSSSRSTAASTPRIVRRSISQAMRSLIIGPAHELLDTRHKNRTCQLSPLSIDIVRPRPITEHGLRVKMLISPEGNHQARHAGTRPGPRSTQGTMADHPATLR